MGMTNSAGKFRQTHKALRRNTHDVIQPVRRNSKACAVIWCTEKRNANTLTMRSRAIFGVGLALFCFMAMDGACGVTLQPLLQSRWPAFRRGPAVTVDVVEPYAYVAAGTGGLIIFDISNRSA